MSKNDLFPDDGTLQSDGSCLSSNFMDGNSYLRSDTNESILISTDDEGGAFFADDNATLPSYGSSHILDEAFENEEIEYKNPIYNDFDYNSSLTDIDNSVLNSIMKYSLNKQDDDNDEKIEVSISSDLEFKNRKRPCLLFDLKQCSAPCVKYVSQKDYEKQVGDTIKFFQGSQKSIFDKLEKQMIFFSKNENFEIHQKSSKHHSRVKMSAKIDFFDHF